MERTKELFRFRILLNKEQNYKILFDRYFAHLFGCDLKELNDVKFQCQVPPRFKELHVRYITVP